MKDKSLWSKIVIECDKDTTLKSTYNAFVKLKTMTEDEELQHLISTFTSCCIQYLGKDSSLKSVSSATQKCELVSTDLYMALNRIKYYCLDCIEAEKPEWQIIAERNGWKKPETEVTS